MKVHYYGVTYRGHTADDWTLCGKRSTNLQIVGKQIGIATADCKTCLKALRRENERLHNGFYDIYDRFKQRQLREQERRERGPNIIR